MREEQMKNKKPKKERKVRNIKKKLSTVDKTLRKDIIVTEEADKKKK